MKDLLLAAGLQLGGVLVVLAEIVIPSFGVLTLIAVALLVYSWILILEMGPTTVYFFSIADLIALPILLYVSVKFFKFSPLTHKNELVKGSGLNSREERNLLGQEGVVEVTLRPFGKALFKDKILEVASEGEVLEKGTPVIVTKVTGMKITVEPKIS